MNSLDVKFLYLYTFKNNILRNYWKVQMLK